MKKKARILDLELRVDRLSREVEALRFDIMMLRSQPTIPTQPWPPNGPPWIVTSESNAITVTPTPDDGVTYPRLDDVLMGDPVGPGR